MSSNNVLWLSNKKILLNSNGKMLLNPTCPCRYCPPQANISKSRSVYAETWSIAHPLSFGDWAPIVKNHKYEISVSWWLDTAIVQDPPILYVGSSSLISSHPPQTDKIEDAFFAVIESGDTHTLKLRSMLYLPSNVISGFTVTASATNVRYVDHEQYGIPGCGVINIFAGDSGVDVPSWARIIQNNDNDTLFYGDLVRAPWFDYEDEDKHKKYAWDIAGGAWGRVVLLPPNVQVGDSGYLMTDILSLHEVPDTGTYTVLHTKAIGGNYVPVGGVLLEDTGGMQYLAVEIGDQLTHPAHDGYPAATFDVYVISKNVMERTPFYTESEVPKVADTIYEYIIEYGEVDGKVDYSKGTITEKGRGTVSVVGDQQSITTVVEEAECETEQPCTDCVVVETKQLHDHTLREPPYYEVIGKSTDTYPYATEIHVDGKADDWIEIISDGGTVLFDGGSQDPPGTRHEYSGKACGLPANTKFEVRLHDTAYSDIIWDGTVSICGIKKRPFIRCNNPIPEEFE